MNGIFHGNDKTLRDVSVVSILIVITFILGMAFQGKENQIKGLSVEVAKAKEQVEIAKNTVVYKEPETPEEYIKYVFKEDADKAFLLLKGDGSSGACAENRNLDPKAKNDNTEWGGRGVDWGLFQINDSWQKVQSKFLLDFKVNTRIAYKLYKESGDSFKLWTCGKQYGI